MEEKEQLIKFIEKFFTNLKADVTLKEDLMIVSNVPENFEKFYGKKSPYKFVFEENLQTGDSDYVGKGSYAVKTISGYLENSGQITLLKIKFEKDYEDEIKRKINLENANISKWAKKKKFHFFSRFAFHTTFQYLNENETVINNIYIYNGEVIEGDLSNYNVEEGKKEEIQIPEMKEFYFLAKDELKNRIIPKTEEVARDLNLKLEKEKNRIENHFSQELREHNENLEKAQKKYEELMREGDPEKISKQLGLINNLKDKLNFEELQKDKERAIHLEKQKHMLNVNNKLFNTTIIYYPLFSADITLRNPLRERIIEVSFDPLTEKLNPVFCESCEKETNNLHLCTNGHISCKDCSLICESCGKVFCKKCMKIVCEHCGKKICRDCATRCFRCGKSVCKSHTKEDKVSGRVYCSNCLRRCERCGNLKEPYNFKISKKTDAEICEECFRKEMQKGVLKGVFD